MCIAEESSTLTTLVRDYAICVVFLMHGTLYEKSTMHMDSTYELVFC